MNLRKIICLLLIFISPLSFADLNIIAVGDTGKGNPNQYEVAEAMTRDCNLNQCDFALLLGDNIYSTGLESPNDPQMIEKFEKPYAHFPVPFYAALGNHDYGKFANEWHKGSYQIEYSKKNPRFILPHYFYSFEADNTLFIILDTSRLFHNHESSEQIQFVKETLRKNKNKWVVMVGHHPYLSNGDHGNAGRYDGWPFPPLNGKVIKDLVESTCSNVDLYIGGHDHSLQTFAKNSKCPNTAFVVSGSGASTDDLKGKNPAIFQSSELGYTNLNISDSQLKITHRNSKGMPLHTYTITK